MYVFMSMYMYELVCVYLYAYLYVYIGGASLREAPEEPLLPHDPV